jgi:hypothetical protein
MERKVLIGVDDREHPSAIGAARDRLWAPLLTMAAMLSSRT